MDNICVLRMIYEERQLYIYIINLDPLERQKRLRVKCHEMCTDVLLDKISSKFAIDKVLIVNFRTRK